LLVILALAIVLRLVFAFTYHEVWWDSGVYIGMGKFLFSYGANGLWEHIRPPLLPLALGILWWIGLDPLLFGRLLEIAFFGGIVGLTFLLAKEWFGEKEAIWSSLIVALSPIFFYLSFHPYTEIPSVFFILLSLWLLKKHSGWAGDCPHLRASVEGRASLGYWFCSSGCSVCCCKFFRVWKPVCHACCRAERDKWGVGM